MGYDYAFVHLYYTIPPAILLSLVYRPLLSRIDAYKILFLISIAVTATIPWDSYLIRNNVWSYPPDAIVGPTLFDIPAEELFFFVIQTYNTSLLYLLLSKATFHAAFLQGREKGRATFWIGVAGCLLLGGATAGAWLLVWSRGQAFYLGLIVVWAGTFMTLLWSLAHQFLLNLPLTSTAVPILLPTIYLWIVDTIALRRGTWVIEKGTKLGLELWPGLEFEEALFFFVTNCMIVFGLVAFDNALAVLHAFPTFHLAPVPALPSPRLLVQALLLPRSHYDEARIQGLNDALQRLRRKSRSFYLASGVFEGRLRIDLMLLYSFCRVADDLIDDAKDLEESKHWVRELTRYLDLAYGTQALGNLGRSAHLNEFVDDVFPLETRSALKLLPVKHLSSKPLYELLEGFEMDLLFSTSPSKAKKGREAKLSKWPIQDEPTLCVYGERVAGTVAELCIELAYHHAPNHASKEEEQKRVLKAGREMGVALQMVNVARDIAVDAAIRRVYIPSTWLTENDLDPEDVLRLAPEGHEKSNKQIEGLRQRLLDRGFGLYNTSRPWIEKLPIHARGPMRVAVESYMEIGRVLEEKSKGKLVQMKRGRATVPKARRIRVAYKALMQ